MVRILLRLGSRARGASRDAAAGDVLGIPVQLCPPEEMLWSKSYVMERERYDGAEVMHLLRALCWMGRRMKSTALALWV